MAERLRQDIFKQVTVFFLQQGSCHIYLFLQLLEKSIEGEVLPLPLKADA